MDKQQFIDRLLETENLTDNLEDDAADRLLNWGISQLDTLLAGVEDEEAAHEKVHALMLCMRGINRIAGNPSAASSKTLAELAAQHAQAFGRPGSLAARNYEAVAGEASSLAGLEAVEFLLNWVRNK